MIYLDNAATTKPFDGVLRKMSELYEERFFNPSALYTPAYAVAKEIENARESICRFLGSGGTVYFTSCATESNTWVFSCGIKNKKGNIVISAGEHASVYENAHALIAKGYDVRIVNLSADGTVNQSDLMRKTDQNTTLVSVLHCNNETGAVNDIAALARSVKKVAPHALFHSDGVQALCKIPVRCADAGIDLYSVSAHKIGGVKGVGALWVRNGIRLAPMLLGGGQEKGERSGTENTAGIIGFAEAIRLFSQTDANAVADMRHAVRRTLLATDNVLINESENNSPYILSASISGIRSEILQRKLAERGIFIGLGSACSSRLKKNRILSAMGRSMSYIEGSIRISFGAQNSPIEIPAVCTALQEEIAALRT